MQAVILAGGKGSRLAKSVGRDVPKPMVPVLGTPLLERTVSMLKNQGFSEMLFLVHHQAEVVMGHFGTGADYGVRISYVKETVPRGTGGALLDSLPFLKDEFLILYGDTLVDIDLTRIIDSHRHNNADVTLFAHPNDHPHDSDLVELDECGRVMALHPYPHSAESEHSNLVNAALYVVKKTSLSDVIWPSGPFDIAKCAIPSWIKSGKRIYGFRGDGYIKDMGTPERLARVEQDLKSGAVDRKSGRHQRSAVFLDRDGTLNFAKGYISSKEDLVLIKGAGMAIRSLNRAGLPAIVITNQPVIARGEASFEEVDGIHRRLQKLLADEGAFLDAILYCPHHPHKGFQGERTELKMICDCRKPEIGLLKRACRTFNISLANSWFVGDTTTDMECARRAGVHGICVGTGEGGRDGKYDAVPEAMALDITSAIKLILQNEGLEEYC